MTIHRVAENIVNEVEWLDRLRKAGVPEHLHEGLVRYLVHGIKPGHFLQAVICNDLEGAIARGDDASVAGLGALVRFFVRWAPAACGSKAAMETWITSTSYREGGQS